MKFKKGPHRSPLKSSCVVMRVCKPKNMDFDKGVAHPGAFELSSQDKAHIPVMLSVYESRLTTAHQAINFIPGTGPDTATFFVPVKRVRRIDVSPDWKALDVVWDDKMDPAAGGGTVRSTAPGADGHSGILNMYVSGIANYKVLRKQICAELAEAASLRHFPCRVYACIPDFALDLYYRLKSRFIK